MPAAVAVPAAISVGSSLVSGLLGSSAASRAAKLQAEEAKRQAQGFKDTLGIYNPKIGEAAAYGQKAVSDATAGAQTGVTSAAQAGAAGATGAAQQANELLQPYMGLGTESAGTLRDLMAPGGEFNRAPVASEVLAQDPGYQFRMDQASKALQASAAARGGALGGGTLGALVGLNQNLASSEYGAAYDRLRAGQNDRFSRLNTLLGIGGNAAQAAGGNLTGAAQYGGTLGYNAANAAGGYGMQGATYVGNMGYNSAQQQAANALDTQRSIAEMMTGGANARAAGTVGSANAWTGALGGIASAAQGVGKYYQDKDTLAALMKNPALTPVRMV